MPKLRAHCRDEVSGVTLTQPRYADEAVDSELLKEL